MIKLEGRRGGIPHLAKNERDMGHPNSWQRKALEASVHADAFAPAVRIFMIQHETLEENRIPAAEAAGHIELLRHS